MSWDSDLYHCFGNERLRPSADLLAWIPLAASAAIVDLGCGAGESSALLARCWPQAAITAVDNSPKMLARARESGRNAQWVEADLTEWTPPAPPDLIYSNAVFHWLDDHQRLFPRLVGLLAPGGVLAVQMPLNHGAPRTAALPRPSRPGRSESAWRPCGATARSTNPRSTATSLKGLCESVEIWETTYHHVLDGKNPVAEGVRSTTLSPLLGALDPKDAEAFLAECAGRLAQAYPPRVDGTTVLAFRRLFVIAGAR